MRDVRTHRRRRRLVVATFAIGLCGASIAGCGDGDATGVPEYRHSWASVNSVRVVRQSGTAVELELSGWLPEGCSRFDTPAVSFTPPDSFLVRVGSKRPARAACTQALIEYTDIVALDVPGDGVYGVRFQSSVGPAFVWQLVVDSH